MANKGKDFRLKVINEFAIRNTYKYPNNDTIA